MKKLLVLGLAALVVVAFTLPASALESQFGGYWRTRMIGQVDFAGDSTLGADGVAGTADDLDSGDQDLWRVDTRTRLYYTAILNENLKLVNKFEFDAVWGETTGGDTLGDLGADGVVFEIKESYADFNVGPLRAKVGIHDSLIARGFIFADEFAGLTVSYGNEGMNLIGEWIKVFEGNVGDDFNEFDFDIYGLNPVFTFGEGISVNPFVYWAYSDNNGWTDLVVNRLAAGLTPLNQPGGEFTYGNQIFASPNGSLFDEQSIYWLGVNADFMVGPASIWLTGVYQGGSIDNDDTVLPGGDDIDISAYLFAVGASMPMGPVGLHGQFFWASGDEEADDDFEAFFGIGGGGVGWAYYWSEIMGLGIFDQQFPAGSPQADVSNLWAVNIGATLKPVEKLTLKGDIWYAALVEEALYGKSSLGAGGNVVNGEEDLGVEIDLVATYQLVEGMNLDLVGAYLFADDGISRSGNNDDDPYEVGARLSLSF
jgi:hypothetical protein